MHDEFRVTNIARDELDHEVHGDASVELKCGHWTEQGPTVVFSGGRRLWTCEHGCGFQERRL